MGPRHRGTTGAPAVTPQSASHGTVSNFFVPARHIRASSKMAATPHEAAPPVSQISADTQSPIPDPVLHMTQENREPCSQLSPTPTDPLQRAAPSASQWDWQSYICSLRTQAYMESFVTWLEFSYRQEIQGLRGDIQAVQNRTSSLEAAQTAQVALISDLEYRVTQQKEHIHTLFLLHDDLENSIRRNNICLWGLPKSMGSEDSFPTVKVIFACLLGSPAGS